MDLIYRCYFHLYPRLKHHPRLHALPHPGHTDLWQEVDIALMRMN